SYQNPEMDRYIAGARAAAATGDAAAYERDVRGFIGLAFADVPRVPLFQPYVNVAMQKNVSGYQYWFHRRLDYRALAKGGRTTRRMRIRHVSVASRDWI